MAADGEKAWSREEKVRKPKINKKGLAVPVPSAWRWFPGEGREMTSEEVPEGHVRWLEGEGLLVHPVQAAQFIIWMLACAMLSK